MRNRVEKKLVDMKTFLEISIYGWNSFLLTIVALGIISRGIWKNKNSGQKALTWLLYFLLDSIFFIIIKRAKIEKNGDYILLATAIISIFMFFFLYKKERISLTWVEICTIILIIFCVSVWLIKGPIKAVFWGVLSESFVGGYLFYRTIKEPVVKDNLLGYTLFLLACIFAILDAPDWSFKEVGYPASEVAITTLTIIPLLIKWRKDYLKKKHTHVDYINRRYG